MTLRRLALILVGASISALSFSQPTVVDNRLTVRPLATGFITPIALSYIGHNDFLLLEKNTGRVMRVRNGSTMGAVLDLPVNGASERGLLGIALHPNFNQNGWVYLYWTETLSGTDSTTLSDTPLNGNRVDRFVWNGLTLTFNHHIARFRSFQADANQPERGNHDGGVLAFGPDGKLYIIVGDVGRRGWLQNVLEGVGPNGDDDQFGGPEPDNAHWTGIIARLNDDGSTPRDNPFFAYGASVTGEVGANLQKTYMYGIRNSFGMAFDPFTGNLWQQENGEDAFDEINMVTRGANGGWIQSCGPISRVAQFREIETTSLHHEDFPNLQQLRWPPTNIATTPQEALSRMYMIPGSHYDDPEFSWKYVLAPAGIGFLSSNGLGGHYKGDLFVGFSTTDTLGGPLFRFQLHGNRKKLKFHDQRLNDGVADNLTFHEMTESESLIFGENFGIVTDIKTAPNGHLVVVSLDQSTVYEVFRR